MNVRAIANYIGYLLLLEGVFMFPALLLAAYFQEQPSINGFFISMIILLAAGFPLTKAKRRASTIYAREGFVTVALGWVCISLFGMLPYLISGTIPSLLDGWFESVSGFTTTGATIITDVDSLPRSMLYWRSFTLWLGGMGVLVFMLAVAPGAKGSGDTVHLIRAEIPGPSVGKLTPRLKHTARLLYYIYIALTGIEIIFLLAGGMPAFDSFVTAFSVAGTGGFAIRSGSIAHYDSAYIELVIAAFMLVFSINFSIYYMILLRHVKAAFKNEELRFYLLIIAVAVLIIGFDLLPHYGYDAGHAFRDSFFHVTAMTSTTGYHTVDYNLWPQLSRYVLLLLMLVGSCAGSTGGGIKVARMLILCKSLRAQLQTMLRPRAIKPVRMDGKTIGDDVLQSAHAYVIAYVLVCFVSIFIVSLDGKPMETSSTAVLASLSNTGPGFGIAGPTSNYSIFSPLSKFVFSLDMLIGRLEIFPMLLLFAPSTWRKKA